MSRLLSIENLSLRFGREGEAPQVLTRLSLGVDQGEKYALVGESGSGKTVTALSILKLIDPHQAEYPSGKILFEGKDLLAMKESEIRGVRGREIAMIFQEPMTALNPLQSIGEQLMEPLIIHQGMNKVPARKRMIELLDRTGIAEPQKRFDAYPHMLSGGQRQRVMIAMALACSPKLLVADEPTTALDVTIQAQILELLEDLQKEFSMAVLIITHDLSLVKRFADRVGVMKNGVMVEEGRVAELFASPQEEYTRTLLSSRMERLVEKKAADPGGALPNLLELKSLRCTFPIRTGFFRKKIGEVKAVDDASLRLGKGETLGIVGESGSGKSTLAYCLLRLQDCRGEIVFNGNMLHGKSQRELRPLRRHFQVVFQDPYSSLSPRLSVEQIVGEGLGIHFPGLSKIERRERIIRVLEEVGLHRDMLWRYPHEFSGGQRQRIAIARVVVLEPQLIVLDEPTSALDVTVQKQVLTLLRDLQTRYGMSYIFISHDLGVIGAMSHRIVVMREGRIVEQGETQSLFENPQEPYTRQLLHASLLS